MPPVAIGDAGPGACAFVVLLPGTDSRDAGIVMERLRRAVESEVHMAHEGAELRVTASVGVTIYVPEEVDPRAIDAHP